MFEEIAQWVIDNRYPKSESEKVNDFEMYHLLIEKMQQAFSGSLPPNELEESLGDTNRQFTIWNDGSEWLISLKGKEQEQCKTFRKWLNGTE